MSWLTESLHRHCLLLQFPASPFVFCRRWEGNRHSMKMIKCCWSAEEPTYTQTFYLVFLCNERRYKAEFHTYTDFYRAHRNTVYTASAQRSSDQGRVLNLRASITFSKSQLILCLSTTNTHRAHLFPLSHSFALFPTLHSTQHMTRRERAHVCMYACVYMCVPMCRCVYLSLSALWLWWCAWRHC